MDWLESFQNMFGSGQQPPAVGAPQGQLSFMQDPGAGTSIPQQPQFSFGGPPAGPPKPTMEQNIGNAGLAGFNASQAGMTNAIKQMGGGMQQGPAQSAAMVNALRGAPQGGQMFNPNAPRR